MNTHWYVSSTVTSFTYESSFTVFLRKIRNIPHITRADRCVWRHILGIQQEAVRLKCGFLFNQTTHSVCVSKQTPAPFIRVSNLLMDGRFFQIRQVNNKRNRWSFPASGRESFSVLISSNEPKTSDWMNHSPGPRVLVAFQTHMSSPRSKNRQNMPKKKPSASFSGTLPLTTTSNSWNCVIILVGD